MKYVLLFVETEQFSRDLEAMGPAEREQAYQRVMDWMAANAGKIRGGNKLRPAEPEVAGLLALVRLHRAIAVRYASGPRAAMTELDDLAGDLDEYHLYYASRAEMLRELGDPGQARAADRRALEPTANPAEQAVLRQRLAWV